MGDIAEEVRASELRVFFFFFFFARLPFVRSVFEGGDGGWERLVRTSACPDLSSTVAATPVTGVAIGAGDEESSVGVGVAFTMIGEVRRSIMVCLTINASLLSFVNTSRGAFSFLEMFHALYSFVVFHSLLCGKAGVEFVGFGWLVRGAAAIRGTVAV
jgi:hypothetical protein